MGAEEGRAVQRKDQKHSGGQVTSAEGETVAVSGQ